jgi:hypothetical protein
VVVEHDHHGMDPAAPWRRRRRRPETEGDHEVSEPDYEQIMQDREEERDERYLARKDRELGRVEDWTATLPHVDDLEPLPADEPQEAADEPPAPDRQQDTPST